MRPADQSGGERGLETLQSGLREDRRCGASSGQVEGVEIGTPAQHGFLGKLLHHLARPGIDDLIDDGAGVAVDLTTWFIRQHEAFEMETRTAAESVLARALASTAATLWLAGSTVATACCAASLTC